MGMNRMADALTATASAYARDDDPELVRIGAPATLKMIEMMLESRPEHSGLLLTACSGYAQYAYAFLHVDSDIFARTDPDGARELRERASRMYQRARGYCVRALARRHPRLAAALTSQPRDVPGLLEAVARDDVPALYWTAVASAGDYSLADDQLTRMTDLAVVRALLTRALALDERWADGAIHEALIGVEGRPAMTGGSTARARDHFDRAVALSKGQSAFAYVALAASVALPAKDRGEFERLLKQALGIDPSRTPSMRLANLIAQRRARFLLETGFSERRTPASDAPRPSPAGR